MNCTSIINCNYNECQEIMNNSQMVELRLETLQLTNIELKNLCAHAIPKIVTCRPGKLSTDQCKSILIDAIKNGAEYVDIEVESTHSYKKEIITIANQMGCKIIISFHNFSDTNHLEILEAIATAEEYNPDVIKIATMVNNNKQVSLLLGLYNQFNNILAIGMGEKGIITRIAATYLGAPFTFVAPQGKEKSAPGQLTNTQMESINTIINQ